jgi:hypothetical protein
MEQEAQILNENSADAANDIRLVGEVLRKDRKATAEFVERFADCVYSYVRRRVMPQAEQVEDLVQEVFLAAWNSLGSFRGVGHEAPALANVVVDALDLEFGPQR